MKKIKEQGLFTPNKLCGEIAILGIHFRNPIFLISYSELQLTTHEIKIKELDLHCRLFGENEKRQ